MTACGIARQVAGTPRLPGAATRAPARQADHRAVTPVGLVCPASSRASITSAPGSAGTRQWRSASPKLVPGAHSCGRRAGPRLTHGHETKTSARRHLTDAERALLRLLRRNAIPAALIVGGVGLAGADVSVGVGWGLVLAGAALAVQPYPGPPSDRSDQAGAASARSRTGHSPRWPQRPPQDGVTTRTHRRSPSGRRSRERSARAHRPRQRTSRRHGSTSAAATGVDR
jgi:hypothetical protein